MNLLCVDLMLLLGLTATAIISKMSPSSSSLLSQPAPTEVFISDILTVDNVDSEAGLDILCHHTLSSLSTLLQQLPGF